VLDLAPFCAVNCKNAEEGDYQILYSLYGIVEHSGTMRSGHYTAYVKVRPKCALWNFSCRGNKIITVVPSSKTCYTESAKGSWFHISDTSVQPVCEGKVLSCQAYLLFYERIH
uniref:ubiquitinyl hydrolase 1 n=1 Tax=Periophthalmus magnuspinnatus TaxID=409849 RepID=A0A3B3Z6Z8_9GOBI